MEYIKDFLLTKTYQTLGMTTTISSLKSYKTPLRYPGGKSRACKKMEPFFPDLRDYDVYYEPFLGGGSVALHLSLIHI